MKKIFIIILLTVASNFAFSQTKIVMNKEGGVYSVPCKINGLPLKFIFDTGASDVSISLTEAIFMLKNGYLKKEDIGESVYYSIANGDVTKGTRLNIKEIEFAGLKLYNIEASVVHETSSPLLLGQSVISKLGKIQIEGNELTILNGKNNSYNYSSSSNNTSISSTFTGNETPKILKGSNGVIENCYNVTFTGVQKVYSYSPLRAYPDRNSEIIGFANMDYPTVTVLEKINHEFYKVKFGNISGILWAGWFKL